MIGLRTLRTFAAAAAIAAVSAFAGAASAQAHHGGGAPHVSGHFSAPARGNFAFNRGRGRDVVVVNRGFGRGFYGPRFGVDIGFGYPYYGYYGDRYYYDGYYASGCHTDYRWDYWTGRPAEIAVQVCDDGYGRLYTVPGSQRWVRWR